MSSSYWSQFATKSTPKTETSSGKETPSYWKQFEKQQEPESTGEATLRHTVRSGTRVGEALLGMPGEIAQLGNMLPEPPKIFQREPNFIQKKGKELIEKLPTSKSLREFTKSYFGDYTEPQNELEQMGDEFVQDVTRMITPGGKIKKALYIATGGMVAKKGMEKLGFSEEAQDIGKLGTMFTMSMINPKGVQNFYEQKYSDARRSLPNVELNAKNLEGTLNSLEKKLNQGITSEPTTRRVLNVVEDLKGKIKNGKINSQELWTSKKAINKIAGDPELFEFAEHYFPKITKRMNYILKKSPELPKEFKAALKEGDQAYGSLHQSKKASRFLGKLHPGKSIAGILAGTAIHAPEYLPAAAGAVIGTQGLIKGYEMIKRVNSNPTMRKYYLNMLKAASEENAVNALHYMRKLEKELDNQ